MGVATVALVVAGGIAIAKGVSGAIKKKKAKKKEKSAQKKLNALKNDYKNIDTSNPFKDAKNALTKANAIIDGSLPIQGYNAFSNQIRERMAGRTMSQIF